MLVSAELSMKKVYNQFFNLGARSITKQLVQPHMMAKGSSNFGVDIL